MLKQQFITISTPPCAEFPIGKIDWIVSCFLIEDFNSQQDFETYVNAKTLSDRSHKFKWITIQNPNFPKGKMSKPPQYAIAGKLYYELLPELKDLSEFPK